MQHFFVAGFFPISRMYELNDKGRRIYRCLCFMCTKPTSKHLLQPQFTINQFFLRRKVKNIQIIIQKVINHRNYKQIFDKFWMRSNTEKKTCWNWNGQLSLKCSKYSTICTFAVDCIVFKRELYSQCGTEPPVERWIQNKSLVRLMWRVACDASHVACNIPIRLRRLRCSFTTNFTLRFIIVSCQLNAYIFSRHALVSFSASIQ